MSDMKNINYRKCRKKDLLPAVKLIGTSLNHLRIQTGKKPWRRRLKKTPPWFKHLLCTDPETFYCARQGDKLIGFAGAVIRGKQWYLAYLFVHPRYQDKGIGKRLLEKIWRRQKGMSHSLCTFAFNVQAVGIYSKFGMAPLCSLPMLKAKPGKLKELFPTGLKIIDTHTKADIDWINRLEKKIRGYPHPQEWKYWSSSDLHKLYIFKHNSRRVGYGMISHGFQIAPVGVISEDYLIKATIETIRLTKPKKGENIIIWCPANNIKLYTFLIDIGFRLTEVEIFMADRSYPDWQRYIPANLAVI
jgi:ribosomal protein S18 acetylase RimI-like enzyme